LIEGNHRIKNGDTHEHNVTDYECLNDFLIQRMGPTMQGFSWLCCSRFLIFFVTGGENLSKILIVDDAAFMRFMLKDILIKGGHEVIGEAPNGLVAIDMYNILSPDLVTMDITMPEMEGTEALKKIRSQHPLAKIIMCSAMGQQHIVVQAIQAGAKDFIVKPFQPDRVIEAINRVIQ
jgi:two-component system chemotaxis response regulator CheY